MKNLYDTFSLKEIGDNFSMGPFGSDIKSSNFVKSGIPVIRGGNLVDCKFHDEGFVFLTDKKADELKNSNAFPGDIVFTHRGTLGQVAIIPKDVKYSRYVISQSQMKMSCNPEKANPMYVYYYFISPFGQHELLKNTSTTGVPAISRPLTSLKSMRISLPSLQIQNKIVEILSSLDDKIEINTRMNKVLEEIARALFHQWFVEFEFPDEKGRPYKSSGGKMVDSEMGSVPEGWRVEKLGKFVTVHTGYSYKGNDLQSSSDVLATIKNFGRNGGFKLNGFKEINISERVKPSQYVDLYDLIVAHTDLTQKADIIGNCELILSKLNYNQIIISMDLVKVVPKLPQMNNFLLAAILGSKAFKNHALGYINGTTVLHLNKKAIPEYKIILPNDLSLYEKMGSVLSYLYQLMALNIEENLRISKLRDTLLPKLMNGEIEL